MAIRVQQAAFDPGQELNALHAQNVGIGAVVGFVGYVRDFNDGREVGGMFLEHYPGMTEKALGKIAAEAGQRWPLLRLEILHRIGRLEPGEPIVFVGCASAHRQAAFDACNFVMDYLKTRAPFWKKEDTAEGPRWVEGRCSDQAAAQRWEEDGYLLAPPAYLFGGIASRGPAVQAEASPVPRTPSMSHLATSTFQPLNIAILTVSDTRTLETDTSGQTLADALLAAGHRLHQRSLKTDDIYQIRAVVSAWIADPEVQVGLITGGTGFTARDNTPQAVGPLFEREVEGFGELFRQVSQREIGTSTIQSRALAGLSNGTLVCCLPGSPGACRTAWNEILLAQLDSRTRPCNFVPHLKTPPAVAPVAGCGCRS